MIVYILLVVFILILHIVCSNTTKIQSVKDLNFTYYIVACISIILIIGLRDKSVGSDTVVYVHVFEICNELSWPYIIQRSIAYRDPGFYIFTKIITYFCFGQEWIYLLIMAALSCLGIFYLIYQTSDKPILSLYFWICLSTFLFIQTGLRQAVAMSLCAYSIKFINTKRIIPFVITILLGAMIHHSSLLFLPVYLCAYINYNKKYILFVVIIIMFSSYIYQYIFEMANKYLIYSKNNDFVDNGYVTFCVVMIINIFSMCTIQKWMTKTIHKDIFYMSMFCLVLWSFRLIDRQAERPSMYFMCFLPPVLSNSIMCGITNDKKINDIIYYVTMLFSFLFFYKRIMHNPLYDYHFYNIF